MDDRARRAVRRIGSSVPFRAAVSVAERLTAGRQRVLHVLTYHRIGDPASTPHLYPGLVTADAGELAAQLDELGRRYDFVALADVLAAVDGGPLPARSLLVTFDDAYRDFLEEAWPVLRRRGIPVTLFVPTAFPGSDRRFWWDRLHHAVASGAGGGRTFAELRRRFVTSPAAAADELLEELEVGVAPPQASNGVLGWEELRSLAAEGVSMANHSRTHPVLPSLPRDAIAAEIDEATADLRRELGVDVPVFAYPGGFHDDETVRAAGLAGMRVAFTTVGGSNRVPFDDPLRLRRIHVGRASPPGILRARMLPVPFARMSSRAARRR